jgi:hypothetical protein
MTMHINFNCLGSLGLVPHLTFQIYEVPSRMTSSQEGEDDEDITTSDTTTSST